MCNKLVLGILVLYNPDIEITKEVIRRLMLQVDMLFISDNSDYVQSYCFPLNERIIYYKMKGNEGIAAAQNVALKYAIKNNYDYVFFIDQDSLIPDNLVRNLFAKMQWLAQYGFTCSGIGPRPFNREQGKKYQGSIKKGKLIGNGLSKVTELINSASLIKVKDFETAGLMDDSLFIDGVDHEWCWRAKKNLGSNFYIDEDDLLSHKLGEGDKKFLFRKVYIPTPFRTYYQFRNYFKLIRRGYVPLYWKFSNGIKYLIKFFYYPVFVSPRKKYLLNIIRGIKDGLFNL